MTREDVIRGIIAREARQQSLHETEVRAQNATLYNAGCTMFGTWETALQYAGIENSHQRRRSRKRAEPVCPVRRQIRHLCREKIRVTEANIRRRCPDLWETAARQFGSWNQALEAAGVNVANCGPQSHRRQLADSQVVDRLVQHHLSGGSLKWSEACCENNALALAAISVFRSWKKALTAAGLQVRKHRSWSRKNVIAALRARQRQGLPIRGLCQHDRPLYYAARRYFGSVRSALLAAGIVD